jgi:hypothetical protein
VIQHVATACKPMGAAGTCWLDAVQPRERSFVAAEVEL